MSHNPRVDPTAMIQHAKQLAGKTKAERDAYLNDFCGMQTPPPANGYDPKKIGKSLAETLGTTKVKALLVQADAIAAKEAKQP